MTGPRETMLSELGDVLRRRRESLSPEAIGIVPHGRRRTPGLRRDEVAAQANMSTVYYERLEQGRGPAPSASMLASLARTLRLTGHERDHLYLLAGHAAPRPWEPAGVTDPGLLATMDLLTANVPAAICDDMSTVLVHNDMFAALFGTMAGSVWPASNIVWRWFTEPDWRSRTEATWQHGKTSLSYVAGLRAILDPHDRDERAQNFATMLCTASPEFAELWAAHPVAPMRCTHKELVNETVGRLDMEPVVTLSQDSSQRLLLLRPADPTAAARLDRLRATLPS
ncbi:helix-turn-helix transcriptional regulator [Catenuloplanes sp. NPDC051500]|uniref:helix-turn-helix transcriptional regulator n=1 Tax=Catenuloplanes sp. NPDC051500 TaxID=3363959 RepID=UPI0037888DD8